MGTAAAFAPASQRLPSGGRPDRHTGGWTMSRLDIAEVRWSPSFRGYERRVITDCVFAVGFFLAIFAAEIAIVHFAQPEPPLAQDSQTIVLPIT
jgi:hypothetical protein